MTNPSQPDQPLARTSEERQERIAQLPAEWRRVAVNLRANAADDTFSTAELAETYDNHAAALEEAITRPTAPARDSKDIRALWDAINGHLPRCRDCADAKVPGTCDHDGEPCDLQTRAMLRIEAWKTAEAHIAELTADLDVLRGEYEAKGTPEGHANALAVLESQLAVERERIAELEAERQNIFRAGWVAHKNALSVMRLESTPTFPDDAWDAYQQSCSSGETNRG